MRFFYPVARWLHRLICVLKIPIPGFRQVERDLRQMYPGKNSDRIVEDYYVKKIALALTVCMLGIILGVAVSISAEKGMVLKEGAIVRGGIRDGPVEVELLTVLENGEETSFCIAVEPRKLKEEEVLELYEEFVQKLPELFLGENESLKMISKDLVLEEEYEAYPFTVEWRSGSPDVLTSGGRVAAGAYAGEVILKARISYEEMEWEIEFPVCIVPESLSPREQEIKELSELLRNSEETERESAEWHLPEVYGDRVLVWEQARENNGVLFLTGSMGVAILVFFMGDRDLHDELEKKRKLMNRAYPDVVQKLALYLGAGLTVRTAFQRIAAEAEDNKRSADYIAVIGEEINYTCREIQSGVSEGTAYEHMAKRIGTREYLRLSTLLIQNLKKGNSALLQRLREEADRTFLERMQNCRKLGEEASTKLLLPMVLFLLVVMVMIMLPAFSSMGI